MAKLWIAPFLLLVCSASAFPDGGVLKYKAVTANDATLSWPDEGGIGTDETAEIQIEDGSKFEGDIFNFSWYDPPCIGVFVHADPPLLIVDGNRDGLFQTGEVYTGQRDKRSSLSSYWSVNFSNVRFTIAMDAREESASYSEKISLPYYEVLADVYASAYEGNGASIRFKQFHNHFSGTVNAAGISYPARLIVRALNPYDFFPKTTVILDSNRDGQFFPLDDVWFTSEGYAYINSAFWKVSTQYREDEAEIVLTPFDGPTGILKLEGEGITQTALLTQIYLKGASNVNSSEFCLPKREDNAYKLPAQLKTPWVFSKIWLTPGDGSDVVYQHSYSRNIYSYKNLGQPIRFTIDEDSEKTVTVGGPLRQSLDVNADAITRKTWIVLNPCTNPEDVRFLTIDRREIVGGDPPPPPGWEMRDERGKIVHQGRFSYG